MHLWSHNQHRFLARGVPGHLGWEENKERLEAVEADGNLQDGGHGSWGGLLFAIPGCYSLARDSVGLRAAVQELVRNKILSSHPNLRGQSRLPAKGPSNL